VDRAAFADLLAQGPILSDGGMGTSLVEAGAPVDACFELLNVEAPDLVEQVHRGFVEAGARLILTNTFGANRFTLERRGLAHRLPELVEAATDIARRFDVLVAGSVGPLRARLAPYGRVRPEQAFEAYAETIEALLRGGVDLILIETQSDLAEIEQAVAAARKVGGAEVPVAVTATFTSDDRTLLGRTPAQVAEGLRELDVDVIGVNCGQGPAQALRAIKAMRLVAGELPLMARANAGGPLQVGGRFLFPATPAYFAEQAQALLAEGVAILGGCCGTRPEHIAAMAQALAGSREAGAGALVEHAPADEVAETLGVAPPTAFAEKLASGRFVVAVEIEPPRGFATAGMLAQAETMSEAGADVIDVADSPMARMRMSPWAACRLIQEHVGIETVLHFPTRGRSVLRLQGDLLAVHALGIRNLFVCLGDPLSIGDYPHGADTVDVTATGLLALITESFNRGRDQAGASIGEPTSFVVGCAVNPAAPDLDRECRLLARKVAAGATFALSQPVFGPEPIRRLRSAYEQAHGELALPILAGVLPLASARHAEFLHNEVPGVSIPEEIRNRLRAAGEAAGVEGTKLAQAVVEEVRAESAGIYLVPQFGRFDVAAEIVESARRG
jgi:homocysteine S-methyltransferase